MDARLLPFQNLFTIWRVEVLCGTHRAKAL